MGSVGAYLVLLVLGDVGGGRKNLIDIKNKIFGWSLVLNNGIKTKTINYFGGHFKAGFPQM